MIYLIITYQSMMARRLLRNEAILMVCDIQKKFTPLVYGREGAL